MKFVSLSTRDKLAKFIIEIKILVARGTGYLSILNTALLIFLVVDRSSKWAIPAAIGTLFLFTFIGYVEIHWLRGAEREATRSFELNPLFMEMKRKVDELHATHATWGDS